MLDVFTGDLLLLHQSFALDTPYFFSSIPAAGPQGDDSDEGLQWGIEASFYTLEDKPYLFSSIPAASPQGDDSEEGLQWVIDASLRSDQGGTREVDAYLRVNQGARVPVVIED